MQHPICHSFCKVPSIGPVKNFPSPLIRLGSWSTWGCTRPVHRGHQKAAAAAHGSRGESVWRQDPDDYFHKDPDAFDLDDYDACVLGAEAETRDADGTIANACLGGMESSCRILFSESSEVGKKLVKNTGHRVEGGLRIAMEHIPRVGENSARVIKKMAKKVVGEENVTKIKKSVDELPEGWMARLIWFWEQPFVKLGRVTMFFARLPAVWALALTQFGIFAGQLSLPMLPPLLLGGGMLLRSMWVNANFIFPRIYLIAILLYITWFGNSVIQKTVLYLRRKGTMDAGIATTIINWTECTAILIAGVIILSMLGVKVSGLFLPAGICLALASKDLAHNFVAGIFLFLVQPFRTGDDVSVQSSGPIGSGGMWLEGTCEKTDLRYTILRKGSQRLFIPNKSFLTREFMVVGKTNPIEQGTEDDHLWDNMPGTKIASEPSASEFEGFQQPHNSIVIPTANSAGYGHTHPGVHNAMQNGPGVAEPFVENQIQKTWAPSAPAISTEEGLKTPGSTNSSTPSNKNQTPDA